MASPRWLLGLVLLASPLSQTLSAQTEADVNASLKKFTQVYEAVESNFADKLDADNAVFKGAIPACFAPSIRTRISSIPAISRR
jgi:hypothetical protein